MVRDAYQGVLRRRVAIVLVTACVAALVGAIVSALTSPMYRATTTLRISKSIGGAPDNPPFDVQYSDRLLNTYRRIVTTKPVAQEMQENLLAADGRTFKKAPDVSAA